MNCISCFHSDQTYILTGLRNAGIDYKAKQKPDPQFGGFGFDLYVHNKDWDKAGELIDQMEKSHGHYSR